MGDDDIKTMMDGQRQSQRNEFEERRTAAERSNSANAEADAAADAALEETVGPDWMRARAAEGARERGRPAPTAPAPRADAVDDTQRQRREYLDRERTNAGNLLRGRPYGTEGNR